MKREDVEQEIVRIVREKFLFGSDRSIPRDASLGELGVGLDSLALVNFVAAVEAAFAVELPDEALATRAALSVGDLAELVAEASRAGPSAPVHEPLNPSVPPGYRRMERLHFELAGRGRPGRAAWAIARLAVPAKRIVFDRSPVRLILERRLEGGDPPTIAPPAGIELRPYEPADQSGLAAVVGDLVESWSRRKVHRWLRHGAIPLVAADGSRVVALDLLSETGDPGEIDLGPARGACWGLYLVEAPRYRGRAIGLALLAYSLQVARERGFRAQLTSTSHDNAQMLVACTQLLGFRVIGRARRTCVLGVKRWAWDVEGRRGRGPRLSL